MAPLLSLVAFALFALFATTTASPHIARHALDHRQHHVVPRVHLDPPVRRRSLNRRCAPSNSTTSTLPSATSPTPSYSPSNSSMTSSTPSSAQPPPTTASAPETTLAAPTTTSSPPAATSSPPAATSSPPATTSTPPPPTTTSTPPPAQTSSSSSNTALPNYLTSVNSGSGTWFDDGLGACGYTNTNSQNIVAISHSIFDTYPGYDGVNPNSNPVCGKSITIYYSGLSVDVTVVDRCVGCQELDLDMAPGPFGVLASLGTGRINITWKFN